MALQPRLDVQLLLCGAHFLPADLAEAAAHRVLPVLLALEGFGEELLQAVQRRASEQLLVIDGRRVALDLRRQRLLPVETVPRRDAPVAQLAGHIFVHLVFQKAADEFLSGILLLFLLLRILRQEHPALDIQQRRRHDQEFAGHVHVLGVHVAHIGEILVRDRDDRDIVDVDLVLIDQVQQKVQRALEDLQLYRDCHIVFRILIAVTPVPDRSR